MGRTDHTPYTVTTTRAPVVLIKKYQLLQVTSSFDLQKYFRTSLGSPCWAIVSRMNAAMAELITWAGERVEQDLAWRERKSCRRSCLPPILSFSDIEVLWSSYSCKYIDHSRYLVFPCFVIWCYGVLYAKPALSCAYLAVHTRKRSLKRFCAFAFRRQNSHTLARYLVIHTSLY